MSKILITGGAGFIGSNLCETLIMQGNEIIVIDNFNNYYDPNIKEKNIKDVKRFMENKNIDSNNFSLYRGDIRNKEMIDKIFSYGVDIVIHLAAMAGVRYSIENPEIYFDVNLNGTLNLLQACVKYKINKFIFASSSSVYGNNPKVPFCEEDNVDNPISPYAATKKAGELMCYTYHHLYNMSIACLRFFTVYGPRQRPDLAIHKFTKFIVEGKSIPFYGDGSTMRDYTYISDIMNGIVNTIKWINSNDKKYDIFNLGESNTISLKQMVSTIEKVIGTKAELNIMSMQAGDVQRTFADISKARNILNYNPQTDFELGIRKFFEWFKTNMSI